MVIGSFKRLATMEMQLMEMGVLRMLLIIVILVLTMPVILQYVYFHPQFVEMIYWNQENFAIMQILQVIVVCMIAQDLNRDFIFLLEFHQEIFAKLNAVMTNTMEYLL